MGANNRLFGLSAQVSEHLANGIIPFCAGRALDRDCGGCLTNFDEQGRSTGRPEKYLNTQCRLLLCFSTLHRLRPDTAGCRELAQAESEFMLRRFWDPNLDAF